MIIDLGLIDYEEAYKIQRESVGRRILGEIDDSVLLAEHYPVFTIGRTGRMENMLVSEKALSGKGLKVLRVDRGGDITFHGPGQLVAYPVLDLKNRGADLHRYLRCLEEVLIGTLKNYSIRGQRLEGKTGVWVNGEKIASLGVAVKGWVTYHGLSLNVNVDLGFFSMINPCGMSEIKMTSVAGILGRTVGMDIVKEGFIVNLRKVFNLKEYGIARTHSRVA